MPDVAHISLNNQILDIKDSALTTEFNSFKTGALPKIARGARQYSNVVMIGDSYLGNGWGNSLNSIMGWTAGTNSRQYANGGAGFIHDGAVQTYNYTEMITNQNGMVRVGEAGTHNSVDLVIVVGGVNDGNPTRTTMIQAVESFIRAAQAYFPNADLAIFPSWLGRPMSLAIWSGICGAASEYRCITARSDRWLFNWFYDFADNTHPGSTASLVAVQMLACVLKGCTPEIRYTVRSVMWNGVTCKYWFDMDNAYLQLSGTMTNPITNGTMIDGLPFNLRPIEYAGNGTFALPGWGAFSARLTGSTGTNAAFQVDLLDTTRKYSVNNGLFVIPITALEISNTNTAGN